MRRVASARSWKPLTGYRETGENVSSLKHFFRGLETGGTTTITDSKGGVVWSPPGMVVDSDLQAISTTMGQNDSPTAITGAWHSFASGESIAAVYAARNITDNQLIRLAIGNINTADLSGLGFADGPMHVALGTNGSAIVKRVKTGAVLVTPNVTVAGSGYSAGAATIASYTANSGGKIGSNLTVSITVDGGGGVTGCAVLTGGSGWLGGGTITLSGGSGTATVTWSADTVSAGFTTLNHDIISVLLYVPGASLSHVIYDATTGAALLTTDYTYAAADIPAILNVTGNYVDDCGAFQPASVMRMHGIKLYAAAFFGFTGAMPADILTDCLWMGTEWMNGNRYISPRLIGV